MALRSLVQALSVELTATGIVPDFHRVPFSSRKRPTPFMVGGGCNPGTVCRLQRSLFLSSDYAPQPDTYQQSIIIPPPSKPPGITIRSRQRDRNRNNRHLFYNHTSARTSRHPQPAEGKKGTPGRALFSPSSGVLWADDFSRNRLPDCIHKAAGFGSQPVKACNARYGPS